MPRVLCLGLLLALVAGCEARVALYAPRRTPTPAHLQATTPAACRDCHDVAELPRHHADDNCLRCHKICKEC